MELLRETGRDLRYAARSLQREPTFVIGVVLTFALAIGTNAAMFGLVERLMLAPPPGIHDANRVMRVALNFTDDAGASYSMSTTSYPVFRAIAALDRAFSGAAAVRSDSMTTGRGADLAEVAVVQASGEYFAVLGARPALGRFFGPADDQIPDGTDVVVLSQAYWQRRFAGEANVIGRAIVVDERPFTIIGVAPRGLNGTELSAVDLFVPMTAAFRHQAPGWWTDTRIRLVSVVARLRESIEPAAAGAMATAAARDRLTGPFSDRLTSVGLESLVPGRSARQSPQARIALWLSGVSLLVLLIATANVGTLLLLRAARRRHEVAVRIALGASRARLARQSLATSLMLALLGCGLGLLLARWFSDVMRVTLLPHLAPAEEVINGRVLLASIVAACSAGIVAGLTPPSLAQVGRRNLSADLRAGAGPATSGRGRFVFQNVLVTVQVTLSTVLVIGAALFVRSLQRVQSQDLGFSTARLLHVTLDFREQLRGTERDKAYEEAVRRVALVPGVTGVTVVQGMPFSSHHIPPISIPGYVHPPATQVPIMYGATPAYLEMMGVRLRQGRLFTERDGRGTPLVVLVNETMARTVWPGQSALGKCVRAGHGASFFETDPETAAATLPCREVVGVVRDSRARSLRLEGGEGRLMQYYVPFAQLPAPPVLNYAAVHRILVRAADDPARLASSVQRTIQSGSSTPVYARVRPYQNLIDPQLRSWRLGATLFSAFGALALGIAAVGLFAVVSYLVTQRTREIGVRLALGGTSVTIGRLIVADAVRTAAMGATVGVVIAIAGAPLVQSMLFQASAREPLSLVGAGAILLIVSIGAAALPAWRASRVSPIVALRIDT